MATEYKSEIRQSQVDGLLEKVSDRKYQQYLNKISLKKIRAFEDSEIYFDFPVTAIIGVNGGGKQLYLAVPDLLTRILNPRLSLQKVALLIRECETGKSNLRS